MEIFSGIIKFFIIPLFILGIYWLLVKTKQKSKNQYQRLENVLLLSLGIPLILGAIVIIFWFIRFGFSKDWLDNYMGIVLSGGILFIAALVIYGLRTEREKNKKA